MGVLQHSAAALTFETASEKVLLRKALPQSRVLNSPSASSEVVATLALALRVAGDINAAPSLRDAAAQQLLRELRSCAPGLIAGQYRGRLQALASDEVEALGADAIQHVLLVALKNGQFRGESDESARAWLRAVLSNFVADDLRRRRRTRVSLGASPLPAAERIANPASHSEEETVGTLARDLEHTLRFLSSLRSFVVANHRSQDAETLLKAAWVQLSYAAGASTEEQVRLWMGDGLPDTQPSPSEQKRFQDRIYQMRHRGREIILRACGSEGLLAQPSTVLGGNVRRQKQRQK